MRRPARDRGARGLESVVRLAPPGEVAQLVEHTTENRGVASSILALAISASVSLSQFVSVPSRARMSARERRERNARDASGGGSRLGVRGSSSWSRRVAQAQEAPRIRRSSPGTSCPPASTGRPARTPPPRRRCTTRSPPSSTTSPRTTSSRTSSPRSSSVDTDGPTTQEAVPFPGVTLLRDRFNVPHVYADTRGGRHRDGGLDPRRGPRPAARAGPLQLARRGHRRARPERHRAHRRTADLQAERADRGVHLDRDQGAEAARARRARPSCATSTPTSRASTPTWPPPTHRTRPGPATTSTRVNALKGQFLGQGGGREAPNSEFLNGLQQQLGKGSGFQAFNDLRQFKNPRNVTSVKGTFPYGHIPRKHPGSVVLDNNSFTPTPAVPASIARKYGRRRTVQASNELMVTGRHSTTGHPILVGGPQISHFFPGLVLEMDMHAPHLHWRGATSAPFPGYLLIGRTPRFSTTLTSASSDIIDEYAETLCGGSNERYLYKGKCRTMGHFDAGTLNGKPVSFLTTVHGPVQGYGRVHGRTVAISLEALQPRQGRARPALLPPPLRRLDQEPEGLLQGRLAHTADLQLLLHRLEAHRRVHERPPPDPQPRRSTRACPPRAPGSSSGGAS